MINIETIVGIERDEEFELSKKRFINDCAEFMSLSLKESEIQIESLAESFRKNNFEGHYFGRIFSDSQKVGFLWWCEQGKDDFFIFDIFIDSEFRRRGYAEKAIMTLAHKGKKVGKSTLKLHVYKKNIKAHSLYSRLGFRVQNENDSEALMALSIDDIA